MSFDQTEKYFVYFLCDPSRESTTRSIFALNHEPFYCGKGTFSRIKSKKSKAVNDKISSLKKKGLEPSYSWIGPFDEKTAFELEEFFVNTFKRRDLHEDGLLLNLQDGGRGGKSPSAESRKRMSDSHKGKSPGNKGKKGLQIAWNKNIAQSEETKHKISVAKKKAYAAGDVKIWNAGLKYRLGAKTSRSIPVTIDGITYPSLIEAEECTGISIYFIKKNYLNKDQ